MYADVYNVYARVNMYKTAVYAPGLSGSLYAILNKCRAGPIAIIVPISNTGYLAYFLSIPEWIRLIGNISFRLVLKY